MTKVRAAGSRRRSWASRAGDWTRRWLAVARERLTGEIPRPAERVESERGEHSGIGFSYKARDGL